MRDLKSPYSEWSCLQLTGLETGLSGPAGATTKLSPVGVVRAFHRGRCRFDGDEIRTETGHGCTLDDKVPQGFLRAAAICGPAVCAHT